MAHEAADPGDEDVRRMLWSVDAEMKAALALSRAALQALTALAPRLYIAADAALEDEAHRAARYHPHAARRVLEIVEDARAQLQNGLADAPMARALERALVDAADALPDTHDLFEDVERRCANG
jgi:hypothetical protein